jgi:hypothetical protein
MTLKEAFNNFKKITPDEDYTKRSRALVVTAEQKLSPFRLPFALKLLSRGFQYGSAIALTSLLIAIIAGGFSILTFLTPFSKLPSLDPEHLRAEAQAIDIQIKLTGLSYDINETPVNAEGQSTIPVPPDVAKIANLKEKVEQATTEENQEEPNGAAAEETEVTIDDALEQLSR